MAGKLLSALETTPLLCDGAMGAELMRAGLERGACGEAWNLTHPEKVLAVQRRYVEAGADCLITNTFGANRLTLAHRNCAEDARVVNRAAVEIAREAFGGRDGFVLGDIGPMGSLSKRKNREAAAREMLAAFAEQAEALVEAGVDAVVIETQSALEELGLAIDAAKAAGAACVIGSMAYRVESGESALRTPTGVTPEDAAQFIAERGADIVGLNCGIGIDMGRTAECVRRYRSVCPLPVMAQPNAGQPKIENSRAVYRETPEKMARGVARLLAEGAGIIGACCGGTPEHIRAFRAAIDSELRAHQARG